MTLDVTNMPTLLRGVLFSGRLNTTLHIHRVGLNNGSVGSDAC